MAEYIERQATLDIVLKSEDGAIIDYAKRDWRPAADVYKLAGKISDIPAADVAPVIRCSECDKAACKDGRGAVWCRLFKIPMEEQGFCSLGEKMDETEENRYDLKGQR